MSAIPNMKLIIGSMNKHRQDIGDISFRTYMQLMYQVDIGDYYKELGIKPNMTVEQVYSISEHSKFLAAEIIRDAIILGMRMNRFKEKLIIKSTKIDGTMIEAPYVDFSQIKSTKGKRRTPGGTIDEDSVTFGTKYINTTEIGKGIKFPYKYNQLKRIRIDLLPLYFQAVGLQFARDNQSTVVDVLFNGEEAIDENKQVVDESAMVIGVANTSNGITEDDYIHAVVLLALAGKPVNAMVANDVETRKAMKWDIFKGEKFSNVETKLKVEIPLPTNLSVFPTLEAPANKMCLVCTLMGIIEHVSQPMIVDTDTIISKRIHEAYATMQVGYSTLLRSSRIVIDGSLEFADSQVKPWLYY